LAHAAPPLSSGKPGRGGHHTTVRGDEHGLQVAPREVGIADLQPRNVPS
jgi:hypothetical protein